MVNFVYSMSCVDIATEKFCSIPALNINHHSYQKDKNKLLTLIVYSFMFSLLYIFFHFEVCKLILFLFL